VFARYPGAVDLAFGRDGRKLITVKSEDDTVSIWQNFGSTDDLVQAAKSRMPRCLTAKQRAAAMFLDPAPPIWCVERRLWPYQSDSWPIWLEQRKAWLGLRLGREPVLPNDSSE
jgi:hypothetical protein